jgi:2-keto-4-pentenoate hydratase/2-oxohepta-3-ene-1,7-dioic acid hydratase in catechol pathway
MRLVTFAISSPLGRLARAGAELSDGSVVDLNLAYASALEADGHPRATPIADALVPPSVLEIVRGGTHSLDAAQVAVEHGASGPAVDDHGRHLRHALADVRLLAPIPRPNSLRDFLAVEGHVRNARKADPPPEWYKLPVHYKGNVDAVFGPEDVVPWPSYTEKLDYELELCAVIGRAGRRIPAEEAHRHIVGYTIFNDWSARDIQRREQSVNLGPAYGKDFANSFGPCIVTADELDPSQAVMRAIVDGEVWSEGTIGGMQFGFAEIIAWLSLEQTLQPGDFLGSGTISGGCGLELDRWLRPGAQVELVVDGIGVLRNWVGTRPPAPVAVECGRRPL